MKRVWRDIIGQARNGLLGWRSFRLMWLASTITSFGGQITLLALPLTALTLLDASPSQMGILGALETIPFTLFSLHVGVLVDRMRKLPILFASDALIGITLLAIPLARWMGVLTMNVMYVVGFVLGICFVIVGTASQVFLTNLAGRDKLIEANGLFMVSDSAARLTGPGVAGALIQWFGAPYAILADCLGFVASFLLMTRINFAETLRPRSSRPALTREIREGIKLVWNHPILRVLTICATLWLLLFQGFITIETLFANRNLGLSPGQIGLAHMLSGTGALLAAALASRITRRFGMGMPILLGLFGAGVAWLLLASIEPGEHAFALMGASLFSLDFGVTIYWINYSSLRQSLTPDALLGRMTGTMRFFTVTLAPLGAYLSGELAESIGARATLLVLGAGTIVLAATTYAITGLRRVPDLSGAARRPGTQLLANDGA